MRHWKFKIIGDVDNHRELIMDLVNLMLNDDPPTKDDMITLLYETGGGCYLTGMDIISILKYVQKLTNVRIINTGHVASMGCAIFLSITDRYTLPNSSFMLHHAKYLDLKEVSAKEAKVMEKDLVKSNRALTKITVKKLKLTKEQLSVYNKGDDLTLDSEAAIKAGMAKPSSELINKGEK